MDKAQEIKTDIEEAKTHKSIDVKMVDDAIVADLRSSTETREYSPDNYISYQKIFKTWKEFNDYADSFFKL